MTPVDQAVTASGLLGNPVVVTILALLFIAGLVGDVAGKWTGPVTAIRARRAARQPVAPRDEHAAELDALRSQITGLVGDVRRLQSALDHQNRRLDEAQEREEIRDQLTADHRQWDVTVVNRLIDLGVTDMPQPPPLHVHPSYLTKES